MRLIETFQAQEEAERIASFLERKKIETKLEGSFDPDTGKFSYFLWVLDEDAFEEAEKWIASYKKDPSHQDYDIPPPSPLSSSFLEKLEEPPKRRPSPFTIFVLMLCVGLFFVGAFSPEEEEGAKIPPLAETLLFDAIPLQGPMWKGGYDWVLLKSQGKETSSAEGPLFVKIRQGEIWRLFTPCLLHLGMLHLAFNMIWLWVLGRAVEERIGSGKSALLTLLLGIVSNTAQYLMSGPLFLGYSGVAVGLAGFIWMRERIAPWEGYPIHRSTFLFLFFFVLVMGALQTASFLMDVFGWGMFQPGIANTAHIVGGLMGAWLGRFSLFKKLPRTSA